MALVALLSEHRLDGVLDAAAGADLWPEVLDVLSPSMEQLAELANRPAARDAVLDSLIQAAVEHSLSSERRPLVQHLSPEAQTRVASIARTLDLDEAGLLVIAELDTSGGLPG